MNNYRALIKRSSGIIIGGSLIGVLLLQPFALTVFWLQFENILGHEFSQWIWDNLDDTVSRRQMLQADVAYMAFGIGLVWIITSVSSYIARRRQDLDALTQQLNDDLPLLIKRGETDTIEFKSSLRWDYRLEKINKKLEFVIAKTLGGFLNNRGGTLLIGVDDEGNILGLEKDYQSLRKKNRDGFELFLMDLVSSHFGADVTSDVRVFFHTADGKDVCRVVCQRARKPAYLKDGKQTLFFLRSGCSTRALDVDEAIAYVSKHYR